MSSFVHTFGMGLRTVTFRYIVQQDVSVLDAQKFQPLNGHQNLTIKGFATKTVLFFIKIPSKKYKIHVRVSLKIQKS